MMNTAPYFWQMACSPKCREHAICQKYGAVFIIGIGCKLSDGKKHDGRAPDYDDYTTIGLNNLPGLNGDLLLWDDVLQRSIELSSMGIRVDKEALQRQLKEEKEEKRLELYFHKRLMNDALPLSIGGGIGQSRLCMFTFVKPISERYKLVFGLKICARNAKN